MAEERAEEEGDREEGREARREEHRVGVERMEREEEGRGEGGRERPRPGDPPGDSEDQEGVAGVDERVDDVVAEGRDAEEGLLGAEEQGRDRTVELDELEVEPGRGELGEEAVPGWVLPEQSEEEEVLAREAAVESPAVEGEHGGEEEAGRRPAK